MGSTPEIQVLRTQEYSTSLEMLSQQKTAKVANYCSMEQVSGAKAFRMKSQIDKTSAVRRTTSAQPAINIDIAHDGRWVYPVHYSWGKVIDGIDLMQTNISPQNMYVMSAVAALNRDKDDDFLAAFYGTAQTGETGATSTSFDSNNVVAVNYATTESLTVEKLRAAKKIILTNEVDLDMEKLYCAITPEQHDNLLGITQTTSLDFGDKPTLVDGRIDYFMGMHFVISNRVPTDSNGYRRVPVWVASGMGCGMWKDINGIIRNRPDLQDNPDYAEAGMSLGFTRLEEAKCVEIKCSEA